MKQYIRNVTFVGTSFFKLVDVIYVTVVRGKIVINIGLKGLKPLQELLVLACFNKISILREIKSDYDI